MYAEKAAAKVREVQRALGALHVSKRDLEMQHGFGGYGRASKVIRPSL
jgi:hypothetical protein